MSTMIDRILERFGDKEIIEKLASMPKSDLNSFLLEVFKAQAGNITPVDVVKSFQTNRFSTPSEINPVAYHTFEAELLSIADKMDIQPILLSPAAPLASCSAFGCVDQKNIVSATRGAEILADPTNMLAIIIADKLKSKTIDNQHPIHYCATARALRAQPFPAAKGYSAHFGLFCIVSSGKDCGSYGCEKDLLVKHLTYYKKLLLEKYDADLSITLEKRSGYTDNDGFFDRMAELISKECPDIPIAFDLENADNHYYKGLNFTIHMKKGNETFELGDGGFVDWTQAMTNNNKERCLISGIGIDRLLLY